MYKRIVFIGILLLLGAVCMPVFADNVKEFLKGNELDDPLMTSLYVAKTFDIKNEKAPDVRVKFERINKIDNWSHGEYQVSLGLEF